MPRIDRGAFKAGHVEFARMGAAAYAASYLDKVMGDKVDAGLRHERRAATAAPATTRSSDRPQGQRIQVPRRPQRQEARLR